ncbi:MAG: hypothetical protein ACKVOM_02740 [Ferruginibacter sp.]
MLDLRNFLKNHFDTQQVSDDNLRKFAEDHLQRLAANNPNGLYDNLLTATQPLYDTFHQIIKQEDQTYTQQQGKTLAADAILAEFVTMVSRKEGAVRSEYGKDSPEYQEFFPLGLNEYHQISKANAEMLMDRMVAAGQRYVTTLGQNFVAIFSDIMQKYIAVRQTQLQMIGKVGSLKSDAENARLELSQQLMRNLLIICANHVGNTGRLDDFFDQTIVRRTNAKNDGSQEVTVPANSIKNIESQGIVPTTEINIKNTGNVPLRFGMSQDDSSLLAGVGTIVNGGNNVITTASVLGIQYGGFLNVENVNGSGGNCEVLLL